MYIHVPAAWMAQFVYTFMAVCAAVSLIWRVKIADVITRSSAPIGASFAFITLVTGSIWGKPTWGRLVGLGRAPDLGPDPVPALSGLYRAAIGL